jgi:hypothetical protein
MNLTCPLCAGVCETAQSGDMTEFRCKACKPYRITANAIQRVMEMTEAHRVELMHDSWKSHANERVLEIRLAPVGSNRVFALRFANHS